MTKYSKYTGPYDLDHINADLIPTINPGNWLLNLINETTLPLSIKAILRDTGYEIRAQELDGYDCDWIAVSCNAITSPELLTKDQATVLRQVSGTHPNLDEVLKDLESFVADEAVVQLGGLD